MLPPCEEIEYCLFHPIMQRTRAAAFGGVAARVEGLRGRMGESTRGVEGLFESLLSESFG